MYKVLWFDDEHETLETIKEDAFLMDIQLFGFDNAEDGLVELNSHYKNYDAVILDGLFFKNSKHKGLAVSGEAYGDVALTLANLKSQGVLIPWFTYSGQKKFVKDKNELWSVLKDVDYANGKVFDKSEEDDFKKLCDEIKKAADSRPERQIRMKYSEGFSPFHSGIVNKKAEFLLIDILKSYENEDYRKKNVTVQRDLLEAIWKSLNNPIPCIPSNFFDSRFDDKPNHEWCTLFMEGKRVSNQYQINNYAPKEIGASFRILKESTNKLSHLADEEIVKRDFKTNTQLLLNILEWLPEYVQANFKNYI